MGLSEIEKDILLSLAEGPASKYEVARTLGKSYSVVFRVVKGLLNSGFIRVLEKAPGRKNPKLEVETYGLTFRGLIEALAGLFEETPAIPEDDRWERVKRIIEAFREYDDYPLFKDKEILERWIGERDFYECLMVLAWLLKNYPHHIFIDLKHAGGPLAILLREGKLMAAQQSSEVWRYGFSYMFFRYAWGFRRKEAEEGPFISPAVRKLSQEVLERSMQALRRELETQEKLKQAYTQIFLEGPIGIQT